MIKRPFIQFAHDWDENNKQDIFQSQVEHKLLLDKLDTLEKKKDVTADEIAKLQTDISNTPTSNFRRIVVDDITPEWPHTKTIKGSTNPSRLFRRSCGIRCVRLNDR